MNLQLRTTTTAARAFTLIEFVLVMAVLMVALGVAAPSLKAFFKGRNLDSEARRFLSLTRYGQSRAVSEAMPMVLWIDAKQKLYGLEAAPGYVERDDKAVEFRLDPDLDLEATPPLTQTSALEFGAELSSRLPMIVFKPDGLIGETSPPQVVLALDREEIAIAQSTNRLRYEIQRAYGNSTR